MCRHFHQSLIRGVAVRGPEEFVDITRIGRQD